MSLAGELIRTLAGALVDPGGASRRASERPSPVLAAVAVLAAVSAAGAATLPRQLQLLAASLGPTSVPAKDAHHLALAAGLARLVVFDRLVPPPTVLLAGLLLAFAVEPLLGLPRDSRSRIGAVIVLGLVPLLVQRVGELVVTYAAFTPSPLTPGWVIGLPQQFVTGPALFWGRNVPGWVEALSPRAGLMIAWSVGLWAVGLRALDGGSWRAWHLALPVACVAGAGIVTWWFERIAVAIILGGP